MRGARPQTTLTEEHRKALYKRVLQTDAETRYWGCILRRQLKIDQWIRFFLLITTSSGAIASLTIWKKPQWAWVWQAVMVLSAILAAYQYVVNFRQNADALTRVYEKLVKIQADYEILWQDLPNKSAQAALDCFREIQHREVTLQNELVKYDWDWKLIAECQQQVFRERGLQLPQALRKV